MPDHGHGSSLRRSRRLAEQRVGRTGTAGKGAEHSQWVPRCFPGLGQVAGPAAPHAPCVCPAGSSHAEAPSLGAAVFSRESGFAVGLQVHSLVSPDSRVLVLRLLESKMPPGGQLKHQECAVTALEAGGGRLPRRPPPWLARGCLLTAARFLWVRVFLASLCVHISSSSKDTRQAGFGLPRVTSFKLTHLSKYPISKYNYVLRNLGVRLQHMNLVEGQNSTHNGLPEQVIPPPWTLVYSIAMW